MGISPPSPPANIASKPDKITSIITPKFPSKPFSLEIRSESPKQLIIATVLPTLIPKLKNEPVFVRLTVAPTIAAMMALNNR